VAVVGSYAYVADGYAGMSILRFTGGATPTPTRTPTQTMTPTVTPTFVATPTGGWPVNIFLPVILLAH